MQLLAAFATLVLLGVPWLFSCFGIIDAADDKRLDVIEGVFQVKPAA